MATVNRTKGRASFFTSPVMIEANIDDMNPQWFDYVLECLFEAGALDVWLESIQMKKNRKGTLLKTLAPSRLKEKIIEIILRETTTLGVRYFPVERRILQRRLKITQTRFGEVRVKIAKDPRLKIEKWIPEYNDCRRLAKKKKVPLRVIYEEILKKIHG